MPLCSEKKDNLNMSIKNAFTPNNMRINKDIEDFINTYVTSFVAWDLIVFFHYNPNVIDSSKNIALKLGRNENEVRKALTELTEKGILKLDNEVYSLQLQEEVKEQIENFVKILSDRSQRLQAVSMVLKKITKQA